MMEGYVGMIKLALSSEDTGNWMYCNGRVLPKADYPELYALIGGQFGPDEGEGFHIPSVAFGGQGFPMIKVAYSPAESGKQYTGMVSQINFWVGDFTPEGWLECDGRTVSRSKYPVYARLVGNQYGGGLGEVGLPALPTSNGVRHLICVEGIDPTADSRPSDDD